MTKIGLNNRVQSLEFNWTLMTVMIYDDIPVGSASSALTDQAKVDPNAGMKNDGNNKPPSEIGGTVHNPLRGCDTRV